MTAAIAAEAAGSAGAAAAGGEAAGAAAGGAATKAASGTSSSGTRAKRSGGGARKGRGKAGSDAAGLLSPRQKKAARRTLRGQRLLVVEFLVCTLVLVASPLTDQHKSDTPQQWMKRATGICFLFVILGAIGAAGPKAAKVAAGLGGLVTVTLLVNDRSVFVKISDRFGAPAPVGPAGPTGGDSAPGPLLFGTQPAPPDPGAAPTLPGSAAQPGRTIRGGPVRFE